MNAMAGLGILWNSIQTWLFPMLEDELGELDEKHREFVSVCELCSPQACVESYRWVGNGCPPASRLALCKAFIAKAVWDCHPAGTDECPAYHQSLRSGRCRV